MLTWWQKWLLDFFYFEVIINFTTDVCRRVVRQNIHTSRWNYPMGAR